MAARVYKWVGSLRSVGGRVYLSPRKPLKFETSYSLEAVTPDCQPFHATVGG